MSLSRKRKSAIRCVYQISYVQSNTFHYEYCEKQFIIIKHDNLTAISRITKIPGISIPINGQMLLQTNKNMRAQDY